MNTGIQDAMALGGLLTEVIIDKAGEERLDGYEAVRRPIAAGVVTMTHRMTRAATARNPVVRMVRNTALSLAGRMPRVQRALAMNLSELATDTARKG
jgi:2-polyprenyl-6-methoxyphenol hydroxylase-like FAD-dependent oxidoreductase